MKISNQNFVRTVLGDVNTDNLGFTQCHEHLFIEKGIPCSLVSSLHMDDYNKTLTEAIDFYEAGGRTVVDAQPALCGRMANNLVNLAKESNLNIISTTGFYKTIFYDENSIIKTGTEEENTSFFISEIKEGMISEDNTIISAKAGIIKGAITKEGFNDFDYKKLFCAIANAALETGVPIMIHTDNHADIHALIDFFESYNIAANRLLICHLDRTNYNFSYHKEVLSRGVNLCYDSVNRLKYLSEQQELELIQFVLDEGFAKQIVLSLDTTNERLSSYGGYMGLDYILKTFINRMLEFGIEKSHINLMTEENAKHILAFRK